MEQNKTTVILVDEMDSELGSMEKMEVHQRGLLHRAFSILVFNEKKELLLQRRTIGKYHSGGLWTNTCCSHPCPDEETLDAANRRLLEEMGLSTELIHVGHFVYRCEFGNGLTEYELDHVFVGYTSETPKPNQEEVMDWKWISKIDLKNAFENDSSLFTYWFKELYERGYCDPESA